MKNRVVSVLLASLAAINFILPAAAVEPSEQPTAEEVTSPVEESAGVPWAPFCLDWVPQQSVEYEIRSGVTYATIRSFVAMVDPEAVVEEENGVVTVTSAKVEQVADAAGDTASVVQETLNMTAVAGAPYIVANGRYLYAKDGLPLLNGSVAAPVRVLAEVFNLEVAFDSEEQTVLLAHRWWGDTSAYIAPGDSYYSASDLLWLSRIIHAESGNQSLTGKIAVGNVVLNRVRSTSFPNNVYDVLYQKNQFSPASNGSLNCTPNAESEIAAKLALDGAQVVPTALFFNRAGSSSYASRTRAYVTTIGAHAFYA